MIASRIFKSGHFHMSKMFNEPLLEACYLSRRVAKMYIYSLTETNGLRFKWRITDVRRNERSYFAVHFGEDFWTCAIWLRHQGSRRSSRGTLIVQVCSASVRGEYTRERVPMRRYHCLQ